MVNLNLVNPGPGSRVCWGYWAQSRIRFALVRGGHPLILVDGVDRMAWHGCIDKFIGMYYCSSMSLELDTIPEDDLREMLLLEEQLKRLETRDLARESFMHYVNHVYDGFIVGRHHKIIAEKLERIASGDLKRLIVNMPPRHSKSEFASYLMPSWFLGRNPKLKIIQATMNTELAVRFGRKVRDLIADPVYAEVFPKTDLKQDSQAAGRWETSAGVNTLPLGWARQ